MHEIEVREVFIVIAFFPPSPQAPCICLALFNTSLGMQGLEESSTSDALGMGRSTVDFNNISAQGGPDILSFRVVSNCPACTVDP